MKYHKICVVAGIFVLLTSMSIRVHSWFDNSLDVRVCNRIVSRQVYTWYLDNDLEELTDTQRKDILHYLAQYQNHEMRKSVVVDTVDPVVYRALETARNCAPKLTTITTFSPTTGTRGTQQKEDGHTTFDSRSLRAYQHFYACACQLVVDNKTEEEVKELLSASYKPVWYRPHSKKMS